MRSANPTLWRHVVRRCCSRRTSLNFNRDKCAANFLGVEIAWHLRKVPAPWGWFSSRDNRLHVLTRQVGDLRYRILVRIAGSGQVTKVRNTRDEPAIMFAVDRCPVPDPVHAFVSLPMSRPWPLTASKKGQRNRVRERRRHVRPMLASASTETWFPLLRAQTEARILDGLFLVRGGLNPERLGYDARQSQNLTREPRFGS